MLPFKKWITGFRNGTIHCLSQSPFLISYFLLIIPLYLLGIGPDSWGVCHGSGLNCHGWHVQDWHVNFLAIIFAQHLQPKGSLVLAPASPRQTVLSRLNPLVCMAEGISTLFTLLSLHFSDNPMSYPAAATLTLFRREASSLAPSQLEDISSKELNKPNYTAIRESLGFSSLRARSTTAPASLYVLVFFTATRLMLNKSLYVSAPVITMLCFHFLISFGFLQLAIVIATSRALTPEEQDAVDEQFQTYLLTHHLHQSLVPSPNPQKRRLSNVDDSWLRLLLFLTSYIIVSTVLLAILQLIFVGPPKRHLFGRNEQRFVLLPLWLTDYVFIFPRTLLICFALMKIANWDARLGKWVYWIVAAGLVVVHYWIRLGVGERLYFYLFWPRRL